MGEMVWHCRETRQPTENTNIVLGFGRGEIPEGLSGSERLACRKRSVENLGGPIGSRRWVRYAAIEAQKGKPRHSVMPKPKTDRPGKLY
jgi:hypothetical protein